MGKKSLADQIAEIANKPQVEDFDIENDESVFQHGGSGAEAGSGSEDDEELKNQHYVSVGKSKLRDAVDQGVASKDKKYTGSKGSRADMFNDDEMNAPLQGESESEDSDAASLRSDSEDESVSEATSQSEDEEDEEEDEETILKKEKLARMVQMQTKQVVSNLAQSAQKDAAKGYAILQQNAFFDKVLDSRIKLQKAVGAANKLPLSGESWSELLDESNTKLLDSTFKVLEKVLTQCITVRNKFQVGDHINQNIETSSFDDSKKRPFKQLSEQTEKLDAELKTYRSAVLSKWSAKVSASSGKSLLQSSKFKAINQSADIQVNNQLADMPRLLKRTKLNRSNTKPLLFDEDLQKGLLKELQPSATNEEHEEEENDLDIPKNYDPRRRDNSALDLTENPYIYDDEDFYRVLLNDLVEKKITNSQQHSNEPIANYEAPENNGYKWSDQQIDEFFVGLLGQKINFNEDEEHDAEDADNEESENIKNDDIQIFG
ncbi:unnamed protein product [Kluyveromyces dobzhanskii CBS 2104]|uniref:WGS project CCBQ000000000 data, contig 00099 n=1 Tax=Kluyveromyces dobzhanskii CBS 2104 TaxID=1427455 RepID=A0A0A8L2T9_9SACH|nr:unnamed protein product [Kluyveromyces dobzhanskii CBS 2104]